LGKAEGGGVKMNKFLKSSGSPAGTVTKPLQAAKKRGREFELGRNQAHLGSECHMGTQPLLIQRGYMVRNHAS
jgi:hypothetical protein